MRKNYIDILKGIGIFFVVIGHITKIDDFIAFIYNFHMPLFFLISGFLFNTNKYPYFRDFFISRFKSIYIPYVLFFIVTFSYWVTIERMFRGEYSVFNQLLGLFYGTKERNNLYFNNPLWFLPCLFSVELLFYYISKIKNKPGMIAALISSFLIGSLIKHYKLDVLPLGLHTAFFGLIFYGIGFLSKEQENYFINLSWFFKAFLLAGCLTVQILAIQGGYKSNIETTHLFYIPLALCGIIFWFVFSILINTSKILEYLGKNSLVILAVHGPIYRLIIFGVSKVLSTKIELIRINLFYCIMITILCIITITPIIYTYNKFIRNRINTLFSDKQI